MGGMERPAASKLRTELGRWLDGRRKHWFLLVVLAALAVLTPWRIREDSPTEDEWAHLVRGISFYQNSDMRIHVQHPPLANAFDALPTAFEKDLPETSQMKQWRRESYAPGLEYIRADYPHAREQLMRSRYLAMLFLAGLSVYAFYFCLSLFGWPTAAAMLLLVAFNPTLIGQARYVTTDMPAGTMAMIAVGELVRYLVRGTRLSILTMSLAFSAAVLVKYSGVLLVVICTAVALAVALARRGRYVSVASPFRRVGLWLGHFAIAGLVVLLSINALYKFDRTCMTVSEILAAPEPKHWVSNRYREQMLEMHSPLPLLPQGMRIPLPYPYLAGLILVREQDRGGYPTYFLGQNSQNGHWAYFPVLLVLKDPPALISLLALGVVLIVRRRSISLASAVFLAVAGTFLFTIMRSNLNMGIRHALPIIPLLSVLAARAFAHAGELLRGPWLVAARSLAGTGLLSAALAAPHYLNYYNFAALGRGAEVNVVGDDWGQDRYAFAKFVREHHIEPLYYHTQTATRQMEIDYLGIKYMPLTCKTRPRPGSWAAVHGQYVHRWLAEKNCAPWLRGLTPVHVVNDNVFIYRIPEQARPSAAQN
jgi:hypothetical protein